MISKENDPTDRLTSKYYGRTQQQLMERVKVSSSVDASSS